MCQLQRDAEQLKVDAAASNVTPVPEEQVAGALADARQANVEVQACSQRITNMSNDVYLKLEARTLLEHSCISIGTKGRGVMSSKQGGVDGQAGGNTRMEGQETTRE